MFLAELLSMLAFAAPAPDAGIVFQRGGEIYVRSAEGAERRLTRNKVVDGLPAWSPDRSRIVFSRAGDLYVMRADGTGVRRLTRTREFELYPAWSPNGRLIAYSSNRGDREPEIYVIRPDGTGARRLTRTARYVQNVQPRFSPDGRFVAFTSNRVAYWNFELFRVRVADGGSLRRLTFSGSGEDGAPGDDIMPAYSPDGKRIAFVSDRDGGYAIWTMKADGSDLREIARHRGLTTMFPRFTPDGGSLVYTTFSDGPGASAWRIWTMRTDGSGRRRLAIGGEADA